MCLPPLSYVENVQFIGIRDMKFEKPESLAFAKENLAKEKGRLRALFIRGES